MRVVSGRKSDREVSERAPSTAGTPTFGAHLDDTIYSPVIDLLSSGSYQAFPSAGWSTPAVYDALSVGARVLLTGQETIGHVLQDTDDAWED